MSVCLVTGSAGLVGSAAARHFASLGLHVAGIDNNLRRYFFGPDGSTAAVGDGLIRDLGSSYTHYDADIRDRKALERIYGHYGKDIALVIHAAGQPSHDWSLREPLTDWDVNATGTINLLELTRQHSPSAPFVFCSTNKVYGDRPNRLPLELLDTRWELPAQHRYADGITEDMPIDDTLHSMFGASKVAADIAVQEYGLNFGLNTVSFRCGTLTGAAHAAAELHGFLAYLMRCAMEHRPYTIYGYEGKQVRDALHARDLVAAFEAYWRDPEPGRVYNMGGGRAANVSLREAITLAEQITGQEMVTEYQPAHRTGDHMWWISGTGKFQNDHPDWKPTYDVPAILTEMYELNHDRWRPSS